MALKMNMSSRQAARGGRQAVRAAAPSRPVKRAVVVARAAASYVVERRRTASPARGASAAPGAPADAVVLSVLQNYSGLTVDRLYGMLRNSGKFNESQSTLNSILSGLVSEGKVQNERGTFRFLSKTGSGSSAGRSFTPSASRSPSPAPRASAAPARSAPSAGSAGDGRSAGDEANVLAVLQNYSGLTEDRLASMLRNSGKSPKSSLSSVLNGLVSQGKVQNERGTYRYVATGKTPTASRTASPPPRASFSSSAASRPASRPATPSAGGGAVSSDETVVLSVLKNYAGLTVDRLANMLRSSGKWSGSASSLEAVLRGLVSKGRVSSERGVYRFGK